MWIYVEGDRFARLRATDVAELGVKRGVELTEDIAEEVMRRSQYVQARESALRSLARRPRSRADLRRRLKTKGFDQSIVDALLDELEALGYLNDSEFARLYAEQAVKRGRAGPRGIEAKLRQQGVASEIARQAVAEAMAGADEFDMACQIASKRMRALQSLDPVTQRRRLYAYLLRRGFSYEAVQYALEKVIPAEE